MTEEEKKLWYLFLKGLPFTVNRQKVFEYYIADFYCAKFKTVIEIDGGQHYSAEGKDKDRQRDAYFKRLGITVLRYSNYEINRSFDEVCEDILRNFGMA